MQENCVLIIHRLSFCTSIPCNLSFPINKYRLYHKSKMSVSGCIPNIFNSKWNSIFWNSQKLNKFLNWEYHTIWFSSQNFQFSGNISEIQLKVAPYSFKIAPTLRTKQWAICADLKENIWLHVDQYFMTTTWVQKAKLTVNILLFPLGKFPKIWQTGRKYFALVAPCFSGKSTRPVFSFWSGKM